MLFALCALVAEGVGGTLVLPLANLFNNSVFIEKDNEISRFVVSAAGGHANNRDVAFAANLAAAVVVESDAGYPVFVAARYNPLAGTLSFSLIHRGAGRIYGLDLGADHHNPTCQRVGEKHKHRWNEAFRDKEAYVPDDITEPWDRPSAVWTQFCKEAGITHEGTLAPPPSVLQEDLF